MNAFMETCFVIYDENGSDYRWVVSPNPDAPDYGVQIEYQEIEPTKAWRSVNSMTFTKKAAGLIAEALEATIHVER